MNQNLFSRLPEANKVTKIKLTSRSLRNTSLCWKSWMMNTPIKCQISKHLETLIFMMKLLLMKANSKNNSNSLKTWMGCKTTRTWTQTISRICQHSNHLDSMAKVQTKIPKNASSMNTSTNLNNSTLRWIWKTNNQPWKHPWIRMQTKTMKSKDSKWSSCKTSTSMTKCNLKIKIKSQSI